MYTMCVNNTKSFFIWCKPWYLYPEKFCYTIQKIIVVATKVFNGFYVNDGDIQ